MAKKSQWAPTPRLNCADCNTCVTAEWSVLDPALVQKINAAKVTQRYLPGELIYGQGSPCRSVHCIESGTIAIRQYDANGNSKMLRTVRAGQTLGYSDYFAGREYRTSAHSLDGTTVCHIPSASLQEILALSPTLGLAFLSHCAEDLQIADVMGLQQAVSPVRVRVVHLLLKFKDQLGVMDDDGAIIISLPMTWQEVAELVGARAETVSRAMRGLEKEHIIRIQHRTVFIEDLDLLLDEIEPFAE